MPLNNNNDAFFKATVFIFCYNQEAYVGDAIESVLCQIVNFHFKIVIVDDCSTDATALVCRKYQKAYSDKIRFIQNKSNKGLIKSYHEAIRDYANTPYVAQCAGDDYWINHLKLQTQVDILESEDSIGLVHTQIKKRFVTNGVEKTSKINRSKTSFAELLQFNCISAPTVCFRLNLWRDYFNEVEPLSRHWIAEDTPMWLYFSLRSRFHFLQEPMVMYRVIPGSVSNTLTSRKYLKFILSRRHIKEYFIFQYGMSQDTLGLVSNEFFMDAEFHILKLREWGLLLEGANFFRKNKHHTKFLYLRIFYFFRRSSALYFLIFLIYRLLYRLRKFDYYRLCNKE